MVYVLATATVYMRPYISDTLITSRSFLSGVFLWRRETYSDWCNTELLSGDLTKLFFLSGFIYYSVIDVCVFLMYEKTSEDIAFLLYSRWTYSTHIKIDSKKYIKMWKERSVNYDIWLMTFHNAFHHFKYDPSSSVDREDDKIFLLQLICTVSVSWYVRFCKEVLVETFRFQAWTLRSSVLVFRRYTEPRKCPHNWTMESIYRAITLHSIF